MKRKHSHILNIENIFLALWLVVWNGSYIIQIISMHSTEGITGITPKFGVFQFFLFL